MPDDGRHGLPHERDVEQGEAPREQRDDRQIEFRGLRQGIAERVDVYVVVRLGMQVGADGAVMIGEGVLGRAVVIDFTDVRDVQLGERLGAIQTQMQMRARHPRHEERDGEQGEDPASGFGHSAAG